MIEHRCEPYILRTEYVVHPAVVMGVTCVDTRESAALPRRALATAYELTEDEVHVVRQVHGDVTRVVDDAFVSDVDGDAMIGRGFRGMLAVKIADCCPVLLFDPVTTAIGAVHSGWRGTHVRIAERAIDAMRRTFGVRPEDLLVVLGPCASGDRYEVRADVAELFPDHVRQRTNDTWLFDNRAAIMSQLRRAGVLDAHVHVDVADTLTDLRYHSHRRDGARAGRSLAYIRHLSRV
jgi:polyphenol oxidase